MQLCERQAATERNTKPYHDMHPGQEHLLHQSEQLASVGPGAACQNPLHWDNNGKENGNYNRVYRDYIRVIIGIIYPIFFKGTSGEEGLATIVLQSTALRIQEQGLEELAEDRSETMRTGQPAEIEHRSGAPQSSPAILRGRATRLPNGFPLLSFLNHQEY